MKELNVYFLFGKSIFNTITDKRALYTTIDFILITKGSKHHFRKIYNFVMCSNNNSS